MTGTTKTERKTPDWADILKHAVEDPGTISEAYRAFHNYSLGNQMAAAIQCLERDIPMGPLATYKGWAEHGRAVRRGEKAIALCAPVTVKTKDTDTDTDTDTRARVFFTWKPMWFTVWQTEGDDVRIEDIGAPGFDAETAMAALGITSEAFALINGNVQGYAQERTVSVSPVADHPLRTLLHEMAHVVLGHTAESAMTDDGSASRDIREAEAESVAYIIGTVLDMPGAAESRGYLQHWLGWRTIDTKSAQRIYAAAQRILAAGKC